MTNRVVRWYYNRRLDLIAAAFGLLLALLLLPLRFLASQIYIKTVPIVLGVACLLYLLGAYRDSDSQPHPSLPTGVVRSLPGLTLALLAAMVVVAVTAEARTPAFHAVAAVAGVFLCLQILLSDGRDLNAGLVLGQVVLFAALLRFGALYTTPGFIGIDIWTHMGLTREIVDAGARSAISHDKYFASPLYHLLVGAASMLFDLPLRESLYLTMGLAMPVAVALVYATANYLVLRRWALLAAMLYAVCDYVVQWSIHLIPTSLGLLFYLGVLYALVRVIRTAPSVRNYVLLVTMSVAVILTHQVSAFIMVVTLAGAIGTQLVLATGLLDLPSEGSFHAVRSRNPVNLAGLFVFDLGLITFMWSLTPYKGDSFLETVFSFFRETLVESAGFLNLAGGGASEGAASGGAAGTTLTETVALYADTLGFLLLLFVTFVGCLYVVNRRRTEQSALTMLVVTAIMLVFVMGLPIFGIRNFIPTRWFAFLYAPMAVLGAIGVRNMAHNLSPRLLLAVLVVFSLAYPGAMLVSSDATVDNPIYEDNRAELSYTEPELTAATAIGDITGSPEINQLRPDQVVFTDHPYQTMIQRRGSHLTDAVQFNGSGPATHDITVYRRGQTEEATYFSVNGSAQILNPDRERVCRPGQNVLYDNGDVVFCTALS
ncbi:hypothetical protein ACKVMT_07330 [Halobacteriales archaeon Cl-PHB]